MPDAPSPTRNSAGTICADWTLRLAYSASLDVITLTLDRPETTWAGSMHLETQHAPADVDEALAQVSRFARACSAVRLF